MNGRTLRMFGIAAVGAGLVGLHASDVRAHATSSGMTGGACSPHGATKSGAGSVFANCAYSGQTEDPFVWQFTWSRDFTCGVGTKCANFLCGSGKSVTDGQTGYISLVAAGEPPDVGSHGGGGGHTPDLEFFTCSE